MVYFLGGFRWVGCEFLLCGLIGFCARFVVSWVGLIVVRGLLWCLGWWVPCSGCFRGLWYDSG